MKTAKVVHILLGKANPERQNGVNRVVYQLAQSQCENGYDVSVWGITKNPVINFATRLFKTRLFKDSLVQFKLAAELKEAIKSASIGTIFHLHGGFLPQLFSVARLLKKYDHAYIYTPHGAFNTNAIKRSKWKKAIYIQLFEKSLVRNAQYIHVIGKSEITGTKSVFGDVSRIELIPNGHEMVSNSFLKSNRDDETIHFGFLGRLDIETKGIDILLNGFAQFIDKGGKAFLHIGGDGDDETKIRNQIKERGLGGFVKLYGAIFRGDKTQFFEKLDFLCLTSRNEGLPGVVLESLAMKIPCIVSPETNMADFISNYNAGFSLIENSVDCLLLKIEKAAEMRFTSDYSQQCNNAVQLIEEEFQWSKISTQLIEAYYEN